MIYIESNCYTRDGFTRLMWDEEDGNGVHNHKWPEFKLLDFDLREQKIIEWHKLSGDVNYIYPLELGIINKSLIVDVVTYIRANPTITLAQYNSLLATKTWYEATLIRAFVYRLALGLAAYYGVVLDNMTESEVLKKVRNWLCGSSINLVKRVCFGVI